jgi:WD40 repeat protein/DNA-binding winged helix-turn-helix (wHTH) protein
VKQPTHVIYEFFGFRLDPAQRILVRAGEPVVLPPKTFETLIFLVQNSGRVLEKDELMKTLWPESFVEEGNLSQNIFVLRKILGDDRNGNSFIQTVPRRGYKFVAPVKELEVAAGPHGSAKSLLSAHYWSRHSPFRGLQVFEAEDAWLFFGRDPEIEELLVRLGRSPVLVIIGNSGCGKSSLVRAGLIPALRSDRFPIPQFHLPKTQPGAAVPHMHGAPDDSFPAGTSSALIGDADVWRVAVVRPSAAPFDYLAEMLPGQLAPALSLREQAEFITDYRGKLPLGGEALRNAISALVNAGRQESEQLHILLVVDQFEELFTVTSNHQIRERYIDALLAASRWDASVAVHLVLILRADFYAHCLEHSGLSRCLDTNTYNVPRMNHGQLREAIERRLALAGAGMESGLMDALLNDVGSEPGNLALLEHALSQLWEKCGGFGCTLTNQAYAAIGRLRGALSAHADTVYREITDKTQKQLAQKIFLELVQLGEDAPDTRRRVRKEELLALGARKEVEALLARLASSRLIAISGEEGSEQEAFVEVSHEALIREWSALREWITQNREEIKLGRRLVQAAAEWEGLKRDPGALLQGARLAQGEEWLLKNRAAPAQVRELVQTSVFAREQAEQRELHRQKAAATRLRWFSIALAALLLAAVGLVWLGHRQLVLAQSRTLVAQSEEFLGRDQGQALDLAIRAWDTKKTDEAYTAVTKALPQTLSVLRHDDAVVSAEFSPDGRRILTASDDHTARVWNAADGRPLAALQGHTDKLAFAAFSPDGLHIVTASEDHTARIWNAADGRSLATLQGHTDKVIRARFSPDGQRIVTAGWDHTPRVWNTADGHLLVTLQGHTDGVIGAAFSPDGQRIVTASWDHTARIWNTADGRLLTTLQGHTSYVYGAEFSPDGMRVVTVSDDHTARLWSSADGRLLETLRHDGVVFHAAFSPDGQRIVTASWDHTARVWNAADGRLLAVLRQNGSVYDAEFSPDGRRVVTAGFDNSVRVWNAADGRLLANLLGHTAPVYHATFSPDGQCIITAAGDSTARVWNLSGGRLLANLKGDNAAVYRAEFSPDGRRIATAGENRAARVWDATNGRLLTVLQGHTDAVFRAIFSPDSQRIATGSKDHTARVWNAVDGRLLATLQGHTGLILDVMFSPDGQRIVTASDDHTARVWNTADGRPLATLQGHSDTIWSARFSPDGRLVVTAGLDHTVRIWNSADGRLLNTLHGHTDAVHRAHFSPDGRRILTAGLDRTARIWNAADGRLVAILQGHTDEVYDAAFSPDGQRIVTASGDHTARVWNTLDGRLLAVLEGHTSSLIHSEFSGDGQRILTTGYDNTARLWSTADGRLLVTLQGHTGTVWTASFSPDGTRIVTASDDQTARIWQVLTLDDIDKMLSQK